MLDDTNQQGWNRDCLAYQMVAGYSVLINGLNGWRNNDGVQFFLEKKNQRV